MNPNGEQNAEEVKEVAEPIVGYCRETGQPLTAAQAEYVDGVMYSREAAVRRRQRVEPPSPYTAPAPPASDVSPGWAFVLGLIPGVGAIYNQQYAKGMFHIIVFAMLISLADRASGALLGFLVAGWFFYMPFEAYHTAQRRQRGEVVDELSGLVTMPEGMRRLPVGPFLLIFLGVVFLLDNLGLLRIDDLLRFWPVLLIAAGVLMLVQRLQAASAAGDGERSHGHN